MPLGLPPRQMQLPDRRMRKKTRATRLWEDPQQTLFLQQEVVPVPPEVLHEIHEALIELLLEAAQPSGEEVVDEQQDH